MILIIKILSGDYFKAPIKNYYDFISKINQLNFYILAFNPFFCLIDSAFEVCLRFDC